MAINTGVPGTTDLFPVGADAGEVSAAATRLTQPLLSYLGGLSFGKAAMAAPENISALCERYAGKLEVRPVSAATGEGLEGLCRRLWELLSVMRVYTKKRGLPPDHDKPFTLEVGSTVVDVAREIHRELPEKMKYARIWGYGRFAGQQVYQGEALHDKDIVEIHE